MATLAVTTPAAGGTNLVTVSANGGGDEYLNTGKESLVVINAHTGPVAVTQVQQKACSHGFGTPTHDIVTSVLNATTEYIPPVSVQYFNDADNFVQVTYDLVTAITVGVIKTN